MRTVLALLVMLALAAPLAGQEEHHEHRAVTAGLLSAVLPGAGQAYNGEGGKGTFFFGSVLSTGMASWAFSERPRCDVERKCEVPTVLAVVAVGLWVVGFADAIRSASRINAAAEGSGRLELSVDLLRY